MIGRPSLLRDEALQVLPVGKIDAAGKAPHAVEHETTFDVTTGAALGGKGRSRQRIRVRAPDILLRLRRKQAQLPIVHADDGEAPGARSTDSANLDASLKEHPWIQLIAPVAPGLDRPEEPSLLELFEGFIG